MIQTSRDDGVCPTCALHHQGSFGLFSFFVLFQFLGVCEHVPASRHTAQMMMRTTRARFLRRRCRRGRTPWLLNERRLFFFFPNAGAGLGRGSVMNFLGTRCRKKTKTSRTEEENKTPSHHGSEPSAALVSSAQSPQLALTTWFDHAPPSTQSSSWLV